MTALPEWMNTHFEHAFKTECIAAAPCHNCKMNEALAIAWEALEANNNSIMACRAMRRITDLGKE